MNYVNNNNGPNFNTTHPPSQLYGQIVAADARSSIDRNGEIIKQGKSVKRLDLFSTGDPRLFVAIAEKTHHHSVKIKITINGKIKSVYVNSKSLAKRLHLNISKIKKYSEEQKLDEYLLNKFSSIFYLPQTLNYYSQIIATNVYDVENNRFYVPKSKEGAIYASKDPIIEEHTNTQRYDTGITTTGLMKAIRVANVYFQSKTSQNMDQLFEEDFTDINQTISRKINREVSVSYLPHQGISIIFTDLITKNDPHFTSRIDGGSLGTVYHIWDFTSGKRKVTKIINDVNEYEISNVNEREVKKYSRKIEISNSIKTSFRLHSHLDLPVPGLEAPYSGYFQLSSSRKEGFIADYVPHNLLHWSPQLGDSFSINQYIKWMWQLIDALNWFHENGIFHGDIKEGNILVAQEANDDFTLKISDLGSARTVEDLQQVFEDYQARFPEIHLEENMLLRFKILGARTQDRIPKEEFVLLLTSVMRNDLNGFIERNSKLDILNLGIVLYYLLTGGSYPYQTEVDGWLGVKKHDESFNAFLFDNKYSVVRPLILKMLDPDPAKRPSSQELLKEINVLRQ
ncbi:MAG: hypothetical protein BGO10_10090 [Chlamydia sp. 32-24]|nr:MAG: hypothetical protein BGO10_10090 [Chlamydia sp. 32-24]